LTTVPFSGTNSGTVVVGVGFTRTVRIFLPCFSTHDADQVRRADYYHHHKHLTSSDFQYDFQRGPAPASIRELCNYDDAILRDRIANCCIHHDGLASKRKYSYGYNLATSGNRPLCFRGIRHE
jgi:hypothetical protein